MRVATAQDLEAIKDQTTLLLSPRKGGYRTRVNLHMGTCGIAAGANKLDALILDKIKENGLEDVRITRSGCAGLCSREPMVTIESVGLPAVKYCDLNVDKIQEIFDRHILHGEIVNAYALAVEDGEKTLPLSSIGKVPRLREILFLYSD